MKIRILGIDYEVDFSDNDFIDSAGKCNTSKTKIWISTKENSPEHAKCVLLHEIIEALNYRLELKLEHQQITSLESSLFQVFKDNPNLLEYLKDG